MTTTPRGLQPFRSHAFVTRRDAPGTRAYGAKLRAENIGFDPKDVPRDVARSPEMVHKQQKAIEGLTTEAAGGAKFVPEGGPTADRRRIPIADAGFEAPGSAYQRIQESLLVQGALDAEAGKAGDQKQVIDKLEKNTFTMEKLLNKIGDMLGA